MTSLTPASRSDEAVSEAEYAGAFNGICTLIPSVGLTALAYYRHPTFKLRTTIQSRTAIAIMPAAFVAALTSELRLSGKMKEMASEAQHNQETVTWAEEQWQLHGNEKTQSQHLSALYEESVRSAGVCVVPELYWYHHAANFTAQNPLKVLLAVATPAVGYIFYGRTGQQHLQLSSMIMHTRVFGQGLTLFSLLAIMGFKSFMDEKGRYISQDQADQRVEQMKRVRQLMNEQLEREEEHQRELKREIAVAKQKHLVTDAALKH